jgi:CheY-like chemotaxis protein
MEERTFRQSRSAILVVDDDADSREALVSLLSEHLLSEQEILILEAANGREAFHLLEERRHNIKLILLDLQMPLMNGWEFLSALRRQPHLPQVRIIVLSAHAPESLALPGVVGVLRKPVDVAELLDLAAQTVTIG